MALSLSDLQLSMAFASPTELCGFPEEHTHGPQAMRKYPCNPFLTHSCKKNESRFHGLKSQLPKANRSVYQSAPISVALAGKAEPCKDPGSLCIVKLTKTRIQLIVFSGGVSASLIILPQTLLRVTS